MQSEVQVVLKLNVFSLNCRKYYARSFYTCWEVKDVFVGKEKVRMIPKLLELKKVKTSYYTPIAIY